MSIRNILLHMMLFSALILVTLTACVTPQSGSGTASSEEVTYPVSEYPAAGAELPDGGTELSGILDTLGRLGQETDEQEAVLRGVWISYLEFSRILKGKSEDEFQRNIGEMLSDIKERGLNTIFVQVRSHGDAYYNSDLYPSSVYVTGKAGTVCGFDPLQLLLDKAKELELSVHAWVNPFRLMQDNDMELISDQYLIRKWYGNEQYMKKGGDNFWYLNPGNEEVQKLIAGGAAEIVQRYPDLDGIQIDDYFYDKVSPMDFGETEEQGRGHVSAVVRQLYDTIKSVDSSLKFGVSPSGNYKDIPVSDSVQLTDLQAWCANEGYLDYIAPQIYWDFDDDTAPFKQIMEKWEQLTAKSHAELYIGLAAYKFADSEILSEEIKASEKSEHAAGYILFRYDNLVQGASE